MLKERLLAIRASAQGAFSPQNLLHDAAAKIRAAIDSLPQEHGPSPVDVRVAYGQEGGSIVWKLMLEETIKGIRASRQLIRVRLSPTGVIRQREIRRTPDGKNVTLDHDEYLAQVIYCHPKPGKETGEWAKDAAELGEIIDRLVNCEATTRTCWACLERGPQVQASLVLSATTPKN